MTTPILAHRKDTGPMSGLSNETLAALDRAGLDSSYVESVVRLALDEDLVLGPDVTTETTVPEDAVARGLVVARASGVVAGLPVVAAVFDLVGRGQVRVTTRVEDGARINPSHVVLVADGPVRALLTAERTMLNLLGRLSGVATLTRAWVDAVAGTGAAIRDTRKTTPGLRALEKYAVRCGGGVNHRMALGDEALIKDNHIAAAGGVTAAFEAVRAVRPDIVVEVECDTLDQVHEAIEAGATLVLLDNMSLPEMRQAVDLARARYTQDPQVLSPAEAGPAAPVRMEASGGLSLDRAREVAETGVDYLSVGALTHSAPVLDLGFDLEG